MWMGFLRELSITAVNLWEQSFANVIFLRAKILNVNCMRAGLCNCEFRGSWAEHWECEFHESWVYKCEFYESWAFWMWIYVSWAELCECEFYASQAGHSKCEFYKTLVLWMWIYRELSIANVN